MATRAHTHYFCPMTSRPHPRAGCARDLRVWMLLACCLVVVPVWAGEGGREHLQRMAEATRSLSYEGTFVYSQGERAETMRVTHGMVDGESRERVTALSGAALELIRHGDQIVCLLPDSKRALIGYQPRGLLPGTLADDLDGVPEGYGTRKVGTSRVAGREAREVRVEPEDDFRYGLRLWLDRDHDLLLRSDLVTREGEVLERVLFTELEVVDEVDPGRFDFQLDGYERVEGVMPASASDMASSHEPRMQPELPAGFELIALDRSGDADTGREHAVYSDGLASVSLFVDAEKGAVREFPAVAGTDVLRMRSERVGDHRVTLIGAVPAATLEYMIDSLLDDADS